MLLASLLLPLLLGVADTAPQWEPVRPDLELRYPQDHGAHPRHQIEWWYLTGQLQAQDGRRFGFQFTVFRSGLDSAALLPGQSPLRARQVLAGHLALTDIERRRTLFAERLRRTGSALAAAAENDLDLALEDWSLRREADDRLRLFAGDPAHGIALQLEFTPSKPLVLHGQGGYSRKGKQPGNASAYSSWTRLGTRGRIEVDGQSLAVEGEAWFDHEFGSSVLEAGLVGWDWFGLQLEDNRELMLFVLRREDGSFAAASAGSLIEADGSTRALRVEDFQISSRANWTSPRTGATYPSLWTVRVPSAGLELEIMPEVADCELATQRSTGVAYWEGPVKLSGSVGGRGYAELTGYAGSMEGRF